MITLKRRGRTDASAGGSFSAEIELFFGGDGLDSESSLGQVADHVWDRSGSRCKADRTCPPRRGWAWEASSFEAPMDVKHEDDCERK